MPRRNPERDAEILRLHASNKYTITQIAERMGVTRSTISGVLLRADVYPSSKRHKSGTRYGKKGSDYWDTRLVEPWKRYHARKARERQEAKNAADRRE